MSVSRVMTGQEFIEAYVVPEHQDEANVIGLVCRSGEWAIWKVGKEDAVPILAAIRLGDWGLFDTPDRISATEADARAKVPSREHW